VRAVVTGGAGFIGSNLVDALLQRGDEVVVVDNLSTGRIEFLDAAREFSSFSLVECDLFTQAAQLPVAFERADVVFHLAANADVHYGLEARRRDLDQNVVATLNVLDAMRSVGARRLLFSSTGSVYGEATVIPTPEDAPFPVQTSLYGASKAAAEGFIAAYAEAGDVSATVFRFVSILGPRYTHGHVIDFVAQLLEDPTTLRVLGDGTQRKSYLDVGDCIAAILACVGHEGPYEIFNLGVDEYCTVRDSISWICERLGVAPDLKFSEGNRGWIGDNPFIYLDTAKVRRLGWRPSSTIRAAVERTVDYLVSNPRLTGDHSPAR
jgi:UDP-glucose 4-epimerase